MFPEYPSDLSKITIHDFAVRPRIVKGVTIIIGLYCLIYTLFFLPGVGYNRYAYCIATLIATWYICKKHWTRHNQRTLPLFELLYILVPIMALMTFLTIFECHQMMISKYMTAEIRHDGSIKTTGAFRPFWRWYEKVPDPRFVTDHRVEFSKGSDKVYVDFHLHLKYRSKGTAHWAGTEAENLWEEVDTLLARKVSDAIEKNGSTTVGFLPTVSDVDYISLELAKIGLEVDRSYTCFFTVVASYPLDVDSTEP